MNRVRPHGHVWADLEKPDELPHEEKLVDACFYQVFSTPDGQRALQYMHELTTFKRNKPGDSDGALRTLEAQRIFVAILEARIERAKKQSANVGHGRKDGTDRGRRRRRIAP